MKAFSLGLFGSQLPDSLFIVLGPESSGTRLATRLLIAAGAKGSYEHLQPFDTGALDADGKLVIRRSVPHNTQRLFQTLPNILRRRETNNVGFVVMVRDVEAIAFSQVKNGHKLDYESAYNSVMTAYGEIYSVLFGQLRAEQSTYLLSYEELCSAPYTKANELAEWAGLNCLSSDETGFVNPSHRYKQERISRHLLWAKPLPIDMSIIRR